MKVGSWLDVLKASRLDILKNLLLVTWNKEVRHRVRPFERDSAFRKFINCVLHEFCL